MLTIHIDDIVSFAPTDPVFVHEQALSVSPQRLFDAVQLAYSHMKDQALCDACHGACGPLADYYNLSYEEYLVLLEKIRIDEAGAQAKEDCTKLRRAEFNYIQPQLVLAMIDAGMPYVCAIPECRITKKLTVDHIIALSRGGTDELHNLRFLCRSHNSAKNDKDEAAFLKLPQRGKAE
jgi:hypothetical protein